MARIYLSSTYGDLRDHREKAYKALRQLGHDVIAMEDYVASDQRPLAKCLEDVAGCELYVGILAHRYGYVPKHDNPDGRSITELEYRHAEALGIPRLVFLVDPAVPWPPPWMDVVSGEGDQGARIRAFREELGRLRLVSFFTTPDQLGQQVSVAVTKQFAARQRRYQLRGGLPVMATVRAWTIPPPVRSFTGRDEELAALRAQLTDHGAATLVPTAALYGMGGVGKTQLALAYAQRYRTDYQLGWWIPSQTELGVVTALADLGVALGLPGELSPAELAAAARDALGERSGWLMIFDNAPDPAAVADYLPGVGGGHVLVTSRDSAWQGIANPVPVDLLDVREAVSLLQRRTDDPDEQAATRLAELLDRLPLALEQAAAYIAKQRLSISAYLELFGQRRNELLDLGAPLAYHGTVDATFTLALDRLQELNPAAVQLLELCAMLASDNIPLALLLSQPPLLPPLLMDAAADPIRRTEVIGTLYQQGLLVRDVGDTVRMHRLIQAVVLSHRSDGTRREVIAKAVEILAKLFPNGVNPDQWPQCQQLMAHVQALLEHTLNHAILSQALVDLWTKYGVYLHCRGLDIRLAREPLEQALAVCMRLYEGDHPEVARSLSNLAVDLSRRGAHERALELDERALAMRQRLYEGDHPEVARSLNNLAVALSRPESP